MPTLPWYTRREFLRHGTLASAALSVPGFLGATARAAGPDTGRRAGVPESRVLVVVQLSGGNDGLNTLIPYTAGAYYQLRPRLAVPEREVITLPGTGHGLHPRMRPIARMLAEQKASIIQGVGYPNPNRSHFASMDIWHTGDTRGRAHQGWIGSAMDQVAPSAPIASVALDETAPLATRGRKSRPVTFQDPAQLRWVGGVRDKALDEAQARMLSGDPEADPEAGDELAFVRRLVADGRVTGARIRRAAERKTETAFPAQPLARQLAMVSGMIRDQMPTRVYYTALGGFDTHAAQGPAHARRLGIFAESIAAFYRELEATGHAGRVLTLAFSEFGRRVAENGSGGTDHGTAGPLFLFGPMVRPGLLGDPVSLENLEAGDLRYRVDFRSIYTTLLGRWLGADPEAVLGRAFRPARVLGG